LIGDGGTVLTGDSAAVTEQHADRDVGRVGEAVDDARREHLGQERVE
jgi:hypothetical protein